MGMVAAFFVAACCMMLRRFPMVMSGVLMMLSSFGMVFSTLMLYGLPPDVLDGERKLRVGQLAQSDRVPSATPEIGLRT
jgi:hypothetical protein